MACSKFENLWIFMARRNFEIDGKINSNNLCTICNLLLIEPYTSECGCHFCASCIRKFQINGPKRCPGNGPHCSNTLLEIDKNVLTDFTTQFKIAKVVVKCPHKECSTKLELEKMEEHYRYCSMKPTNCPFQSIGCEDTCTSCSSVSDHLHKGTLPHSQLLIEALNNLRNDFDASAKLTSIELKNYMHEISELKQREERNRNEVTELCRKVEAKDSELRDLKKEMEKLQRGEKTPKNETNNLKKSVEKYQTEMDQFKKELLELKAIIDTIKQSQSKAADDKEATIDFNSTKITQLTTELNESKHEMGDLKKALLKLMSKEEFDKQMKKCEKERNVIQQDGKKCSEEIKKVSLGLKKMDIKMSHDFIWIIDNFSKKKSPLNSEEFTRLYYRFNLSFVPSSDGIKFYVRVLKGLFDGSLEWPVKHGFTISVVNQKNMTVLKSGKYSVATATGNKAEFNRPTDEMNGLIGGISISAKELKTSDGLTLNDSMIVCCSINVTR